ncbi:Glutaminyl-tRNA synthetase [hydrothermal vent metagenome]|uniref:glutamine--tRNA ligase n=1 Tax=hydrothermal vent metagenome TaxID=652676 RepID=A0A3B1DZA2_9ZZZZ
MSKTEAIPEKPSLDFVRQIVVDDIASGKWDGKVQTRFPPEPNGYLHIGHAKSICLNFGIAQEYSGQCNLRFDDTNPTKEETEYVDSIKEDVRWLGFDWGDHEFYASDYFEQLYNWAVQLIQMGQAYVDSLTLDEIRDYRGTVTVAGKESPYRSRSVEENLELFQQMREGKFKEGEHVLRAMTDMASSNMLMRDPVMYRILHAEHHRTGNDWCIYPMYDFAHGQSDSIEGVTHSICTLEFEDHRPLYDWYCNQLEIHHPQQIEFARLNLTYTVMSKRKLLELVQEKLVSGWDDPRMPTICGLRRRGYTSLSIHNFCNTIGVTKHNSLTDLSLLENALREDLNMTAERRMGVIDPLKVVIENYPENQTEEIEALNNPNDESAGKRIVPFTKEFYIEREDFMEEPPKKFFRLAPGREVRLKYAYYVTCTDVIKDESTGKVIELRCTYDPETKGGSSPDGRKIKGTLHWVSAQHAVDAEVRLYDNLFNQKTPEDVSEGEDYKSNLNPESLVQLTGCKLEPSLSDAVAGDRFQFERLGYFCIDSVDSTPEKLVVNRTVALRDQWARIEKQRQNQPKK